MEIPCEYPRALACRQAIVRSAMVSFITMDVLGLNSPVAPGMALPAPKLVILLSCEVKQFSSQKLKFTDLR